MKSIPSWSRRRIFDAATPARSVCKTFSSAATWELDSIRRKGELIGVQFYANVLFITGSDEDGLRKLERLVMVKASAARSW
jgi:hypothetical protein